MSAQVRATPGQEPGRAAVNRAADGESARRRRGNLGRLAMFGMVLTVLVAADALYMHVVAYQPDDRHRFGLSDAGEMSVAAALLAVVTLALFGLWRRAASGRS